MKAVHNLSTGDFDVYYPVDSVTAITLPIPTGTRFIKQCVFAEDGRTLVCGGDEGTVHVFQLGGEPQRKTLSAEGSVILLPELSLSINRAQCPLCSYSTLKGAFEYLYWLKFSG
jgi:hypothetical protein